MTTHATTRPCLLGLTFLLIAAAVAVPGVAHADHAVVHEDDGFVRSVRWSGETRYDTAARLAVEWTTDAVAEPATSAILATGEDFPDALAGSYLAGAVGAPVLLTRRDSLPQETLDRLTGTGSADLADVETIYLLGGPEAVVPAVELQLVALGYEVVRLWGDDRVATAVAVADHVPSASIGEVDGLRTAIVATSQKFPDALVAGAAVNAASLPLLLTDPDVLSDATRKALGRLDIEQVVIAGGQEAIAAGVEAELGSLGYATHRLAGADRHGTAVAFADFNGDELGFTASNIGIARSDEFPDALALAPFAGRERMSVVLTQPNAVPEATSRHLTGLASCRFSTVYLAGGHAALSQLVELVVRAILTRAGCADVDNVPPTIVSTRIEREGGTGGGAAAAGFRQLLPAPNDGLVIVTYSEPVRCTGAAPEQFRHTSGRGRVTPATSLECNDSAEVVLGFPAGVLDRTDGRATISYVAANDPAHRISDLQGNVARITGAIALFVADPYTCAGVDLDEAATVALTTPAEVGAVATDGDVVVTGSPVRDGPSGNVYVHVSDGAGGYEPAVKLVNPTANNAFFGRSVAVSGDTIVVGADGQAPGGAAYVYTADGAGGWDGPTLLASPAGAVAGFGRDVAIDGHRIVVGAPFASNDAGAAYVFERTPTGWSPGTALDNPGTGRFGLSVDVDGSRIVVGAPRAGGGDRGAAYAYDLDSDGDVVNRTTLEGPGAPRTNFGWEVATDGARVLVGTNQQSIGSAYVFEATRDGSYGERVGLTNPTDPKSLFGFALDIAGDQVVVGAFQAGADDAGGTFAYASDGAGAWSEPRSIAPATAGRRTFGATVAVSPDRIVIGHRGFNGVTIIEGPRCESCSGIDLASAESLPLTAPGEVQAVATDGDIVVTGSPVRDGAKGNAYVHVSDGAGGFAPAVKLSNPTAANSFFGRSVAISDDTIVVGADGQSPSGGAYVYVSDGAGGWTGPTTLTNPTTGTSGFGRDVAIDGDRIVVGAPFSNVAYVYERDGGTWSAGTPLAAPGGGSFGWAVDVDGDRVVVGAHGAASGGRAYVYVADGAGFEDPIILRGDGGSNEAFGWDVAIDDDRVAVGSNHATGSAYVFEPTGEGYDDGTALENPTDRSSLFGFAVAIAGDQVIVGAFQNGSDDRGGVFAFHHDGRRWSQARAVESAFPGRTGFGEAVAISADRIVARYRGGAGDATVVEGPRCDGSTGGGGDGGGGGGGGDPTAYEVNVATDEVDADTTDGICETATAGECSLRAAIMQANADDAPTTITFAFSFEDFTFPEPVLTTQGAGNATAASGDLDVTEDLTIVGSDTIVDAEGLGDRVFDVVDATLAIERLRVKEGHATATADDRGGVLRMDADSAVTVEGSNWSDNSASDGGGAIANDGGALTLVDVVMNRNEAGTGEGGAIRNAGGTLTVHGGMLWSNKAIEGGAIWSDTTGAVVLGRADPQASGPSFTSNQAPAPGGRGGGAVLAKGGTLEVVDADFSANRSSTAGASGGGLLRIGGSGTITHSNVESNFSDAYGGGIALSGGSLTISNTTLKTNWVEASSFGPGYGGGVSNVGGTVTVTGGEVSGNDAVDGGGFWTDASFTVSGTKLRDNKAHRGGAFYNAPTGSFTFTDVDAANGGHEVTVNGPPKNDAEVLGNVYVGEAGATVTVSGSTFTDTGHSTSGDDEATCSAGIGDTADGNTDDDGTCFAAPPP